MPMLPTLNKLADAPTQSSPTFYLLVPLSWSLSWQQPRTACKICFHYECFNESLLYIQKGFISFEPRIIVELFWNIKKCYVTSRDNVFKGFYFGDSFGTIALPLWKVFKCGNNRRRKTKLTKDGRVHNALSFCWLLVVGILFFQSKTIKHNFRI